MMSDKFSGHPLLAEDCLEKESKLLFLNQMWSPLPTKPTGQDCLDRQDFHSFHQPVWSAGV